MAAPNSRNKQFTAFLTSTLDKYREKLADTVFRANAVLDQFRRNDLIRTESGGSKIIQPLLYAENDTVKAYQGYEELDTTPQDGITAAEYDWKQVAGTISISRRERRLNSGEEQLMNLFEKKIMQAESSMQQTINDFMLNSFDEGPDGKELLSLPQIMAKDPSSGSNSSIGQIDGANQSWWRNRNVASGATSLDGLKRELRNMFNLCQRGGMNSRPDIVLMDQGTFERYEASLDDQVRYQSTDEADIGFENLQLKSATVFWDETVPDVQNTTEFDDSTAYDEGSNPQTGTAFFITSDFMELIIDSETNFVNTEFQKPHDQDAFISQILFMGELTVSNREKQGVLYDINRI